MIRKNMEKTNKEITKQLKQTNDYNNNKKQKKKVIYRIR